jgi:hypothetical protein
MHITHVQLGWCLILSLFVSLTCSHTTAAPPFTPGSGATPASSSSSSSFSSLLPIPQNNHLEDTDSTMISVEMDASSGNRQQVPVPIPLYQLDASDDGILITSEAVEHHPHECPVTETVSMEVGTTVTAHDDTTTIDDSPNPPVWTGECGLWVAPSTLPGAGFGLFAGRDFVAYENFQVTGDIVIPLVDLPYHTHLDTHIYKVLYDEYTWGPEGFLMHWDGHFVVKAASPGMGAVINSFYGLFNVQERSNLLIDSAGLHRSTDPGVGGFTPYHNRRSTAIHDVLAGQELFTDYGPGWFEYRSHLGPIPLYDDLDKANELVQTFHELESIHNISQDVLYDAWDSFVRQSVYTNSRVLGAFHHDDSDELELLKDKDLATLRLEQSTRSQEWLQHYGTCADHMQEGPSTLRQAGRGAIASRHLPAGTIVSHMPLTHIVDRTLLDMYAPVVEDSGHVTIDHSTAMGQQLLLNYCYGHDESSLLLFPYSPMVNLINHNQSQVNVRLQWADPGRSQHMSELLEHSLKDLEFNTNAKLAMDLVAIRDIQEGDEIFLDYGDSWEAAWQHHVQTWKPAPEHYVTAEMLNADPARVRTEFEQLHDPYPSNIEIKCSANFEDPEKWQFLYDNGEYAMLKNNFYPCEVLEYEEIDDDVYHYNVVITKPQEGNHKESWSYLMTGVPRLAIWFADIPYSSDIFLSNAFRHSIGIPDEIFPAAWRNLQ